MARRRLNQTDLAGLLGQGQPWVSRRMSGSTPITVDDVLNSGWVTTPYHKLDCSLISDGGAAFIVVGRG